ncbi:nitrogen metabolite repression-(nmr)-responsible protein [Blumeria hordei DH14]|uniref:Nitrogen metabolite repression-(Nmr)-responsible protein n=1 Tax=Blumeria graminis f. sp. hordei (strain DH14) TaxID=546991 RepID=N1JIK4_BLUG1|nr:nitrogen metabolite repression-(nmr)-responsible protein [Blumeria hordei DH14]
MPFASALPIRSHITTHHQRQADPSPRQLKHRSCHSSTELLCLPMTNSASLHTNVPSMTTPERPSKRPVPTPSKTIAVVNSSGRQAASFIRVASAVGYRVRAQLRNLNGIIATEISCLPNVTVLVGDLYIQKSSDTPETAGESSITDINYELIRELYRGAQLAFINTTFWGDEVSIGKALADEAVAAKVEHYIYSSMPDHAAHNPSWPSLPLWSSKAMIEDYILTLPYLSTRATFIYTGIYNNNFTSLPYPLFCMAIQPDNSFEWTAPFHPDAPLPWLDAEHDVGPAVLQIFKDGVSRWGCGERIALAYEVLSPREACRVFSMGVGRPVRYMHDPKIEVKVHIPNGYREQLLALEKMYGLGTADPKSQPFYFGSEFLEKSCPNQAMEVWEGYRGLEEYAREVFPLEESANGLTWMNDEQVVPLNQARRKD